MLMLSLWGAGFSVRGGERVSLLNSCLLTSFYKGGGERSGSGDLEFSGLQ